MDIAQAAAEAVVVLTPYLPYLIEPAKKAGEKVLEELSEKAGGAAFEAAKRLWGKIRGPVEASPAAREAAIDLAHNPQEEDSQAAFRRQVRKILEADPTLAEEFEAVLREHRATAGPILIGGGAQVTGHNNIVAGKGGIAIGGSVQSSVVSTGARQEEDDSN